MSKKYLYKLIEFFKEASVALIILALGLIVIHFIRCVECKIYFTEEPGGIIFLNSLPIPIIILLGVGLVLLAIGIIFQKFFKIFKK